MMTTRAYLICTTPRSGSSLLAAGLGATKIAGTPAEWFEPKFLDAEIYFNRQYDIRHHREFLERIVSASSTQNGVFGAKVHAFHTNTLLWKLEDHHGTIVGSLHKALMMTFPDLRYIYLTRANTIKQAVSFYRASASGAWYSEKRVERIPVFDQYGIKKSLQEIERSKTYWEGYFAVHGITPLRIEYEEFISKYEFTLKRTLEHLGLDASVPIPPPQTARQSDDLSLIWEEEFLARESQNPIEFLARDPTWAPY